MKIGMVFVYLSILFTGPYHRV